MKKLFLVFSVDSALLSHRKDLAVAALKQGYEVTIVAKDTGHKSQIMQMGFKFVDLPINRVGTNIFEEFKTLYFLIRLYKRKTGYRASRGSQNRFVGWSRGQID